MYRFGFDSTYILVLIGALLCFWASSKVKNTYRQFSTVSVRSGVTGAAAAEQILRYSGIYDVAIRPIAGNLTDNYDPVNKVLHLSDAVFNSNSIAAVAIAAHECGHAVQHKEAYIPIKIRSFLVPIASVASHMGIPIFIIGIISGIRISLPGGGFFSIADLGIWIFTIAVLFQLVTLPVEYNASGRALVLLKNNGIVDQNEIVSCKKMLGAAALTYVAALAASTLNLLRLILISKNSRRRR